MKVAVMGFEARSSKGALIISVVRKTSSCYQWIRHRPIIFIIVVIIMLAKVEEAH
jgi:hypothetical protein